jgi:hypothetical protein
MKLMLFPLYHSASKKIISAEEWQTVECLPSQVGKALSRNLNTANKNKTKKTKKNPLYLENRSIQINPYQKKKTKKKTVAEPGTGGSCL